MNRKFRAWDEEAKVMYYSTDYENCTFCVDDTSGVLKCFVPKLISATRDEPEHIVGREISPIMESIGFKDKSGKEIYEEDIVKSHSGKLKVVKYHITHNQCGFNIGTGYHIVIGNIHDNPELWETKDE